MEQLAPVIDSDFSCWYLLQRNPPQRKPMYGTYPYLLLSHVPTLWAFVPTQVISTW